MSIRIIDKKVVSKSVATNRTDLAQGFRLKSIESEGVDTRELHSMIDRLRKLAHSKEKSAGTVNQINLEASRITSQTLAKAMDKIDIQSVINESLTENPLVSTVSTAAKVLRFKPSVA